MNMEKANSAITGAWIAGAISGVLTMIVALIGAFGYDLWSLLDAFLILGLTFGIYKKNRACAVILFVWWIGEKIYTMWEAPETIGSGLFLAILFGYWFFQGIRGTFAYHKVTKAEPVERMWKPMTAGILNIVAGAFGLFFVILLAIWVIQEFISGNLEGKNLVWGLAAVFFGLPIVFGTVAIIGGYFALRRRRWRWALAGLIAAFFLTIILGVIAILFTTQAKKEFQ